MNVNILKPASIAALLLFSTYSYAQLSTPNGTVNTSSSANIGIGTNAPVSRLDIKSNGSTGLFQLNYTETQGSGGDESGGSSGSTTVSPSYALKLNYKAFNLSPVTTFLINGTGETFIGNFNTISNSPSTLNVRNSMAITHSNSNAINLSYQGTNPSLIWNTTYNSNFSFSNGSTDIMTLSNTGKVGIGTSSFGSEKLKVNGAIAVSTNSADNSNLGVVNGLSISTNGSRVENFAIKANTYYGDVFTVSDRGNVVINCGGVSNSGDTKLTYGLTLKNGGTRGHDYILSAESAHGKVFTVGNTGYVHIGTNLNRETPDGPYLLYVEGGIRSESYRADVANENGWADYVFEDGYELMSLREIESFIDKNGHLPNVPTTKEVMDNGVDLVDINRILLEKVEELTLQLIELDKKIENGK